MESPLKNIQLMLGFNLGPFLVLHFSYYTLMTSLMILSAILSANIAIFADDTTLYFKWDQASDILQQLELASELESDRWDTVDWGRNWLVDFNAGET